MRDVQPIIEDAKEVSKGSSSLYASGESEICTLINYCSNQT